MINRLGRWLPYWFVIKKVKETVPSFEFWGVSVNETKPIDVWDLDGEHYLVKPIKQTEVLDNG